MVADDQIRTFVGKAARQRPGRGPGICRNSQSQWGTTQVRSACVFPSAAKPSRSKIVEHRHPAGEFLVARIAPYRECGKGDGEAAEIDGSRKPVVRRPDGRDAQRGQRTLRLGKSVDALVEHVVVGERQDEPVVRDAGRRQRVRQEAQRSSHGAFPSPFPTVSARLRPPGFRNCRSPDRPTRSATAAARRRVAPCGWRPPRCRR